MMNPIPKLYRTTHILLFLVLSGCGTLTVPPGDRGTVRVMRGGLVETIAFGGGPTFNKNDAGLPCSSRKRGSQPQERQ